MDNDLKEGLGHLVIVAVLGFCSILCWTFFVLLASTIETNDEWGLGFIEILGLFLLFVGGCLFLIASFVAWYNFFIE